MLSILVNLTQDRARMAPGVQNWGLLKTGGILQTQNQEKLKKRCANVKPRELKKRYANEDGENFEGSLPSGHTGLKLSVGFSGATESESLGGLKLGPGQEAVAYGYSESEW